MLFGVDQVVAAGASLPLSLADQGCRRLQVETAELLMRRVGDEGQCALRALGRGDREPEGAIDAGDHLSHPEIIENRLPLLGWYPEGHAAAGAAWRQSQDQARALRGAAVAHRIDAEAAMIAAEQGRLGFMMGKDWIPQEGAASQEQPALRRRWTWVLTLDPP